MILQPREPADQLTDTVLTDTTLTPIVPPMSEKLTIKKRQRQRKRSGINLSTKHLLGLVVLALVTYGAFRVWVGNPWESVCGDDCESMFSLLAWVMAFAMIFGAIILAGAIVGVIVALLKRRAAEDHSPFSSHPDENGPVETPDASNDSKSDQR